MTACCWACSTIALFLEILRSAHKQKMQRPSPAHACAEPTSETMQTETTALRRWPGQATGMVGVQDGHHPFRLEWVMSVSHPHSGPDARLCIETAADCGT